MLRAYPAAGRLGLSTPGQTIYHLDQTADLQRSTAKEFSAVVNLKTDIPPVFYGRVAAPLNVMVAIVEG